MSTCEISGTRHEVEYFESFPPQSTSAVRARRFVRQGLEEHALNSDAAELIISELITNVIEHARTRVGVKLVVGPAVRLEVQDGNAILPAVVEAAAEAEHGRGLFIVDALAHAWGVEPMPTGKRIWVEIPRDEV